MADELVAVQARTSLQALNTILAMTGNSPVTDYNSTSNLDIILARNTLEETSLEVQEDSWEFNREVDFELVPDGSNEVVLTAAFTDTGYTPEYIARIDFDECKNKNKQIIVRGGKAYDKEDHTYEFTHSVFCDVVWYYPWLDLPNDVRYYITIRAARKFNISRQGSDLIDALLREQEQMAYVRARGSEMDRGDYNALKHSRVLRR